MTEEHRSESVARALEVALFAPLGLAAYVRDVAPSFLQMFVARGRAEVDRRQEDVGRSVRHARGLGEVTLAFGVPKVREELGRRVDRLRARAGSELANLDPRPGDHAATASPDRTAPEGGPPEEGHSSPAPGADADLLTEAREEAGLLAIPGYDALSASQVVERLAGLGPAELDAVREYEETHRGRRTILGKIEQLIAT